eukprot:Lankesteria_metandrocarpae@DN1004_c0_g1_i1.p2
MQMYAPTTAVPAGVGAAPRITVPCSAILQQQKMYRNSYELNGAPALVATSERSLIDSYHYSNGTGGKRYLYSTPQQQESSNVQLNSTSVTTYPLHASPSSYNPPMHHNSSKFTNHTSQLNRTDPTVKNNTHTTFLHTGNGY